MNVWLSYSNEDIQIVNQIRDQLSQISNIHIYSADLDIRPGDIYIGKIVELIKNSQIFLIFISKNSEKSGSLSSEVAIILDKESLIPPFLNRFAGLDLSTQRKILDNISLLIDSIETDSKITLSNDEINIYYKDYIKKNNEKLEQEKEKYKKKSLVQSKKLFFYLVIYFYVLISIFLFIFVTEIIPVTTFTSELFLFLLGVMFGILCFSFIDYFKIKRFQ